MVRSALASALDDLQNSFLFDLRYSLSGIVHHISSYRTDPPLAADGSPCCTGQLTSMSGSVESYVDPNEAVGDQLSSQSMILYHHLETCCFFLWPCLW